MNVLARFESPISHSIDNRVQNDSIYLTCHTALSLLIFIAFRVLDSMMSSGRFKSAIKFDEFDHSQF
jgi:hypothetical protein